MATGSAEHLNDTQAKDIKSVIVALAVIVVLGLLTTFLFYKVNRVDSANIMAAITVVDIVVAFVLVWLIPGHKWAYFWGAIGMGILGFVLTAIALAIHGFAAYVDKPLSRIGIGLFLCSLGAGAAAYMFKRE